MYWAREVTDASQGLTGRPVILLVGGTELPLEPSKALELIDSDLLTETFDYVVLELGERRIYEARRRLGDLLRLLVNRPVNSFTARYLEHIGVLYLWGFDVEVHVMCRTVIDAVLQELIPGELAKDLLRKPRYPNQFTLHDRLCLARCTSPQILNRAQWERAWKLKEDGNDILHTNVDHILYFPDALDSITQLQVLLESMPSGADKVVLNRPPRDFDWNERPSR